MRIQPLNDWAVIIPAEAATRTAGGLFIPETAKDKPAEGVVEAIGPGAFEEKREDRKKKDAKKERKFIPTSVKPGERVFYERYAGQTVTVGAEERVLVREKSILGILPPLVAQPKEDLPPLQIPAVTASSETRALAKRPAMPIVAQPERPGTPVRAAAKKKAATKKTAKKKTAKKPAKNVVKSASKKTAKKTVKKAAKKTAKKKAKKK
ncbi:MAG: co-chaperone GroES [Nitrospiraceae bacterium]|nr:co-chaperone GroES [Nitrospiraceae bacterium]